MLRRIGRPGLRPRPPPSPSVTFTPADGRHRRGSRPSAGAGRGQRRLVPARHADQPRRQGRRRRAEPRPHRLHHHRTAGLRRAVHLGRFGGRPATARRSRSTGSFTTVKPDHGSTASSSSPTARPSASRRRSSCSSTPRSPTRRPSRRRLTVTTTPPVEGSWAWLPDEAAGSRVHWRTREYYPAGTTVHVDAKLYGVAVRRRRLRRRGLDAGLHHRPPAGRQGRGHQSHRIQVITDDGVIIDFPCSYGEADLPRNVTRSGIHVVSEKYEDFYMSNPAAGYSNVHERWAVRISNNGEFIHANPTSPARRATPTSPTAASTCRPTTPSSTSTPPSTATPSRSPARRSSCPTPTATSGTGRSTGTTWTSMSAMPTDAARPTSIPSTAPVTPTDAPTLSGTPTTDDRLESRPSATAT